MLYVAVVHSFSLLYSILLYDYTITNISTVDGYLHCFQLLATINHAAMIIVYMSPNVTYKVSPERNELLGHRACISFALLDDAQLFF